MPQGMIRAVKEFGNISNKQKGSIFVFALWSVLIMSIFALYVGYTARMRISLVKKLSNRDVLRFISEAGIYNVINDINRKSVENPDFLFSRVITKNIDGPRPDTLEKISDMPFLLHYNYITEIFDGIAYCSLSDEQAKFNLNTVDPVSLKNLLVRQAGLGSSKAKEVAYSILDWRDADNERPELQVVNNEDLYYKLSGIAYSPKNADFELIEEILLVKEVTPSLFRAIEPYITVYGDGRVNINTCSRSVLGALGLESSLVNKILMFRTGKMLHGDERYYLFDSTSAIIQQLELVVPLEKEEKKAIDALVKRGIITVDSVCFRIVSVGSYFGEYARINCIIDKKGTIKYWKEDFIAL